MSYLQSTYTRNNIVGKTIADVKHDKGSRTRIIFTDGTYVVMEPYVTEVREPVLRHDIVCTVHQADNTVIPAKGDE